ncbi:hypothetical protein QQF64_011151 [Cirrhinus molitorella]|uniref:Uncharacterized protein n=1 Tax=Cirrhinus molitorella TaxID=172907 RepID=A0ABR3M221_9TELE
MLTYFNNIFEGNFSSLTSGLQRRQESQNVLCLSFMSCSFGLVDVKYILKESQVQVAKRQGDERGPRWNVDGEREREINRHFSSPSTHAQWVPQM